MEQMNKEELIEYFIEQLGNNEVLGKYMTIDQMGNKLNSLIKNVTYETSENTSGYWEPHENTVNISPTTLESNEKLRHVVVHELVHVLSSSGFIQQNKGIENEKVGIHYARYKETNGKFHGIEGYRALNEGITEAIAMKIIGAEYGTYEEERNVYKVVSKIVGEDVVLQEFFASIEQDREKEKLEKVFKGNLFETAITQKYGSELGKEINSDINKIRKLSDKFNRLVHRDDKPTKEEEEIAEKVKKELKKELITVLGKDIIYDDNLNYHQKIEALANIKKEYKGGIPKNVIDRLFETQEKQDIAQEEKIKQYMDLVNIFDLSEEEKTDIFNLYVESGKIEEGEFPKKEFFWNRIARFRTSYEEVNERIEKTRYKKIGDYYLVGLDNYRDQGNYRLVNKEGEIVKFKGIGETGTIKNNDEVGSFFPEIENIDNFKDELHTWAEYLDEADSGEKKETRIFTNGNIILFHNNNQDEPIIVSANKDGTLEWLESRRRKKICR